MNRRLFWLFLIFTILVGCSKEGQQNTISTNDNTETMQEPTATVVNSNTEEIFTIQFAVNDLDRSQYEQLIPIFEEENPNIKIAFVSLNSILTAEDGQSPEDEVERLATAADVFPSFISPFATQAGLVRDLTPFIQADRGFQTEDYPEGILDQFRWQGGLWAIPMTADVELIFFNKNHFDEAGLPYPEPGWTWDTFTAAASALTEYQGNEVARWGYLSSPVDRVPFIVAQAGALVNTGNIPPLPQFTAPEVMKATDKYVTLMTELAQPENSETLIQAMFAEGRVSMWPGSLHEWDSFAELPTIGVAPFPIGSGDTGTSLISVQGLSMSGGTQQPDAAWRWISFLSRQHLNSPFTPLPMRQSVATSTNYWENLDPELATALQTALEQVYVGNREVSLRHFLEAIDNVQRGDFSVTEALTNAQENMLADLTGAEVADLTPSPTVVVSAPDEENFNENVTVITFSREDRLFGTAALDSLREEFHQKHPDIHIEFIPIDISGGLLTLPKLAAEADCFQGYPRLHDADARASVLNLDPFIDADNSLDVNDFYPAAITPFTVQGQVWGLPTSGRLEVIEYNRDIFDTASVAYPSLEWNLDDFLGIALALTQGEETEKIYGFVPDRFEWGSMLVFSERLGAMWVDDTVEPPRTDFTNPATVEAIRWYIQLTTEFAVKPTFSFAALENEDRDSLITEGRAAMWITINPGEYELPNIGVVSLPSTENVTGFTNLSGFFISSATSSNTRQACWQWLTFLTEQPNATWGFPARRSIAESDIYRAQVGADLVEAYQATISGGEQLSSGSFAEQAAWIRITQWWLFDAYDQVVAGESDLESSLAAAQSLADAYRNCIIDSEAIANEEAQWDCVREFDEDLYYQFQGR